jgi:hypothetical protein
LKKKIRTPVAKMIRKYICRRSTKSKVLSILNVRKQNEIIPPSTR